MTFQTTALPIGGIMDNIMLQVLAHWGATQEDAIKDATILAYKLGVSVRLTHDNGTVDEIEPSEISKYYNSDMIRELRERTGAGIKDCEAAIIQSGFDRRNYDSTNCRYSTSLSLVCTE
jgi:hypothetical protein